MNVGIVGLGFMAMTHLRAYGKMEDANILAVCNPSGRRLDGDLSDVAGNLGGEEPVRLNMEKVRAFKDYQEMLAQPDIDVIDICTPTSSHVDLSIQALQAGKHVLCEKPLARSSREAERLVEALKSARSFFMPAMCLRFWPEWQWLKNAIANQDYGGVLDAHFKRVGEPPAWSQDRYFNGENSGGALIDLHVHDTDFIYHCFGMPSSVYSTGYSRFSGAYDHVLTQYRFARDLPVSAEGSWTRTPGFGFNMTYTVNFENATADYDLSRGKDALRLFRKDHEPFSVQCEGADGFFGELKYFLNAVRENKAPSVVTAEDALQAIRICEAEEASIRTRKEVAIGEEAS